MKIRDLFKKRGKVSTKSLSLENAELILNSAESFTIPDIEKIDNYMEAFDVVLKSKDINDMFSIVKFIRQKSANGLIYVVKLNKSKSKFSKLLIKIQKHEYADPASYEYYIGLVLNRLRSMDIPNFGLVYGRFFCGFNPSGKMLCDKKYANKTNVLYEYITSLSDKTITLQDYIDSDSIELGKKTINLINILVMLLISLQKAQDILQFTHYDLHLGNVLLVELNETYNFVYWYNDKKYNIMLDYFPFIIDYGRSHVNPVMVDDVALEIYDMDKNKYYTNFEEYQDKMWKGDRFIVDKKKDVEIYKQIIKQVNKLLRDEKFVLNLRKVLQRDFDIKNEKITVNMVIEKFYTDENGDLSYGITPWKFNESFDHCTLLNHVCGAMINKYPGENMWYILMDELEKSFPFIIPGFYGVLDYHQFKKDDFRKPIDVVDFIYIESQGVDKVKGDKSRLYYSQIGGMSDRIYKDMYRKLKKRWI